MRRGKLRPLKGTNGKSGHPRFFAEPNHYQSYELTPRQSIEGKHNFGRHVFIERDGTAKEVIRLNVLNDRHREDIVAYHFCMQYGEIVYWHEPQRPEFYIVGRDDPWDYRYVMHDGSRFNVEICRVASTDFLSVQKAENDCSILMKKANLYGFEIIKVERHFPSTFSAELVLHASTHEGKKQQFPNSQFGIFQQAFLRPSFDPKIDVEEILREAIIKKAKKNHTEKDETHLILDNLTTHATSSDFFEAVNANASLIEEVPFLCIWLYTGYYSDDDGTNCEFSLSPIKVSAGMEARFQSFVAAQGLRIRG